MEINSIQELFEKSKNMLEGQHGTISITFANRSHVYTGNDVIGNCLQEWLPNWFKFLGVDIKAGKGSQVFPDFVATFGLDQYDVEVKAWNINNAPAFDLANFLSFIESTYRSPGKINAYYFILGYNPVSDGFSQGFTVEKIFLKHIWEMTSPSKKYPIGMQVKRDSPYALRPCNFYKNPGKCFESKEAFILAVKDAFEIFPGNFDFTPDDWYEAVSNHF